jgi:hypothetical protein
MSPLVNHPLMVQMIVEVCRPLLVSSSYLICRIMGRSDAGVDGDVRLVFK